MAVAPKNKQPVEQGNHLRTCLDCLRDSGGLGEPAGSMTVRDRSRTGVPSKVVSIGNARAEVASCKGARVETYKVEE
jgi:hypothetical protein